MDIGLCIFEDQNLNLLSPLCDCHGPFRLKSTKTLSKHSDKIMRHMSIITDIIFNIRKPTVNDNG